VYSEAGGRNELLCGMQGFEPGAADHMQFAAMTDRSATGISDLVMQTSVFRKDNVG
jgi:hypothetical protein